MYKQLVNCAEDRVERRGKGRAASGASRVLLVVGALSGGFLPNAVFATEKHPAPHTPKDYPGQNHPAKPHHNPNAFENKNLNANINANINTNKNNNDNRSNAINKVTINSNSPTNTTVSTRVSGKQKLVTPGSIGAPSLAVSSVETCLGSVSGGVSVMGGGFSFGSTVRDEDCNRRLYARQLYNMGFVDAAVYIQCLSPEVQYAMAAAGTPCAAAPVAAAHVQPPPARAPLVRKAEVMDLPVAYASDGKPEAQPQAMHSNGDDGRGVLPEPVFNLFR